MYTFEHWYACPYSILDRIDDIKCYVPPARTKRAQPVLRMKNRSKNDKQRAKRYCFTLNNYSVEELEWLGDKGREIEEDRNSLFQYLCFEEELGEEGTPHLQGYFELRKQKTIISLKREHELMWGFHFAVARGSKEQNKKYCNKEGGMIEWGGKGMNDSKNRQGNRTDLEDVYADMKNGMKMTELLDKYPKHVMMYPNGLQRAYFLLQKKKDQKIREVDVRVYWGDTGAGKTKAVFDEFGYDNVFKLNNDGGQKIWFDGYMGEECLLIDDFNSWIKMTQLLTITDIYPLRLEVKGAFTSASFTTIIITSNKNLDEWYRVESVGVEHYNALKRRVKMQVHFENENKDEDIKIEEITKEELIQRIKNKKRNNNERDDEEKEREREEKERKKSKNDKEEEKMMSNEEYSQYMKQLLSPMKNKIRTMFNHKKARADIREQERKRENEERKERINKTNKRVSQKKIEKEKEEIDKFLARSLECDEEIKYNEIKAKKYRDEIGLVNENEKKDCLDLVSEIPSNQLQWYAENGVSLDETEPLSQCEDDCEMSECY